MRVFVLNMRGEPLMPCPPGKARILLKEKKAVVKHRTPFTIQLTYATGEARQPVSLGLDCGYRHIGLSASTEKEELFSSEVLLRTDIPELISTRKQLRHSRRNRKTRHRAPRFDNRVRPEGWLPPSVENCIGAHLSRVAFVLSILPVTKIVVETASFDIQKIKNPEIEGAAYQQGEQFGFENVREYVLFRDEHTCQHCKGRSKDPVLNVHHIESRKTGGDAPNNLITLCKTCHQALHRGEITLKVTRGQSFRAETFMNVMRWTIFERLKAMYPHLEVCETYGYITKHNRRELGLAKTHHADAFCIAGNLNAKRLGEYYFQRQTRKHNRQIHKLTILKGGIRKRNQAPYIVHGFRLFDKVLCKGKEAFIFGRRASGYFDVRELDGTRISASISYKKLKLLEPRRTFLTQRIKKGGAIPPLPKGRGFLADF